MELLVLVVVALAVELEKVLGLVDVTDLVDVVDVVEDWVVVVGLTEELVVTVLPGGWKRKSGLLA